MDKIKIALKEFYESTKIKAWWGDKNCPKVNGKKTFHVSIETSSDDKDMVSFFPLTPEGISLACSWLNSISQQ